MTARASVHRDAPLSDSWAITRVSQRTDQALANPNAS